MTGAPVKAFLHKLGLGDFSEPMKKSGYDDVEELASFDNEDLQLMREALGIQRCYVNPIIIRVETYTILFKLKLAAPHRPW
mmetsp:Transcript_22469/g.51415  ORF Transcript_22469/g.51415 Transcript_22469/m.51415 type:complete len:81 (-) Transcript_22469:1353-1595(-)